MKGIDDGFQHTTMFLKAVNRSTGRFRRDIIAWMTMTLLLRAYFVTWSWEVIVMDVTKPYRDSSPGVRDKVLSAADLRHFGTPTPFGMLLTYRIMNHGACGIDSRA